MYIQTRRKKKQLVGSAFKVACYEALLPDIKNPIVIGLDVSKGSDEMQIKTLYRN